MYDIAIIGLGPAGSTLARLLSPKYKVVAIDKKIDIASGFKKPCGGLLATDAQRALSMFHLTLPKNILVDPQIFVVETTDFQTGLVRNYPRFYMNMDRHKFDLWLESLIPPSVNIIHGSCKGVTWSDEGFTLKTLCGSSEDEIKARFVVGADGANSIVRRALFPNKKMKSYVSIQEWFEDKNPYPIYSCFFDAELTDCYAWGVSKDGKFVLGGAFPHQNCAANFDKLKEKLPPRFELGAPEKREACLVLRPSGPKDFVFGGNGAFLIGEAAGLISPSSLEGISYAFNSASKLADVFNTSPSNLNKAYNKAIMPTMLKLLAKNLKSIFLYTPILRWAIMKTGIGSINIK